VPRPLEPGPIAAPLLPPSLQFPSPELAKTAAQQPAAGATTVVTTVRSATSARSCRPAEESADPVVAVSNLPSFVTRIRSHRIFLFVLSRFGLLTPCRRRPQIAAGRLQVTTVRPNELHAAIEFCRKTVVSLPSSASSLCPYASPR
jgi:hypothetical protein